MSQKIKKNRSIEPEVENQKLELKSRRQKPEANKVEVIIWKKPEVGNQKLEVKK